MRQLAIVPFVLLVACGDDGGSSPPVDAKTVDARLIDASNVDAPPDSPPPIDAAPTVFAVACPNNDPADVTAPVDRFVPMTSTISVGDILKFTMPSFHNVVPHTTLPSDPGLQVDFGATVCLQFTVAGTYNFKCNPHGFVGSVTVQ